MPTLKVKNNGVWEKVAGGAGGGTGPTVICQEDEPTDLREGVLWLDLDETSSVGGSLPSGGTAGQFLSIGSDGNPTWVSLTASEEVQF